MQTKRRELFTTVRTEGAILPADLLQRVAEGDNRLEGLRPQDYHVGGEKLNEAVNRAWNRLLGAWKAFHTARQKLPETDRATSVTRGKWLLPLFRELDYGRLPTTRAIEVEDKSYVISHIWEHVPIHLLGWGIDLNHRTRGVAGAATSSPHSMVQALLNRSDAHLWAFLSNGRTLRVLRDNVSLTRQAFVEFDLQAMMEGEVYADFALLWLLCHRSRVEILGRRELGVGSSKKKTPPTVPCPAPDSRLPTPSPHNCWLEKWSQAAHEQGTRALDQLRNGVEQAIKALGRGFLAHPNNAALRDKLCSGALSAQDYYRQLLRMVYRLLFLFVAEDRGLLLDPKADQDTQERYTLYYSTARIRRLAERHRGTRHSDLYHGLTLVMEKLGSDAGCPELGLPALGSFLWSKDAIADLAGVAAGSRESGGGNREEYDDTTPSSRLPTPSPCHIANPDLLCAVRELAFTVDRNVLRAVDYKNLGVEELGSIYESLLELHPQIDQDAGTFELGTAAGHERKTTGSYYTPTNLINCLLDSALDPVLDEAVKGSRESAVGSREKEENTTPDSRSPDLPTASTPESRILALKVCDPACGSGHFLIAAAHRIGKRLAAVRTGDDEPAPDALRHALRDVIGRCIYGVDINPMAVELCKINLWLESLEPGKPLSFLDHHIQCGNSLLGTTPALLAKGIPNEAFTPIEGDLKAVVYELKKRNKTERRKYESGQGYLFAPHFKLGNLPATISNISAAGDDSVEEITAKQAIYEKLVQGTDYLNARLLADLWCAVFVWNKDNSNLGRHCPTERDFRNFEHNPHCILPHVKSEVRRVADQYQFVHWHLAFPDVFWLPREGDSAENNQTEWNGGFDVILGNPPFVGGLKISELYGDRVRHSLNCFFTNVKGKADLCSLMVRRAFDTLSTDGRVGMVATNAIGQGQTRETGLAQILQNGGRIAWVRQFVRWPGTANVEVTLIVLAKGDRTARACLDGNEVAVISSRLDSLPETEPNSLRDNRHICFQGSIVLGKGFIIEPSEANAILAREPASQDCLCPYLTGEDINTHPTHEPSRWVIQFGERTADEAQAYKQLWSVAVQRILPERQGKDAEKYPRMVHAWWKHWNNRHDLYDKVRPLNRALARSRVSEFHMLAWVRTDIIFSDACVVFALDSDLDFAVLQSGVHEVWLRREASTMRTDVRYTPTDCFVTFPLPKLHDDDHKRQASSKGQVFYAQRQAMMRDREIGFTKLYNLVHDPKCGDEDISALRAAIVELDRCVLQLYGLSTIPCDRDFEMDGRGRCRFVMPHRSREEMVRELTNLNLKQGTT